MNNRPWYLDELLRAFASVYFTLGISGRSNPHFWRGVLTTLAALAIYLGANPQAFMSAEDVQKMRQ